MARKAQREWTQVSSLVGRITFSVSGGKDANDKKTWVPKTEGFTAEVTYESESDKTYNALCNSVVAIQATLKNYYLANGRFPATPGKVFKVLSDGTMDLPVVVHVDRLEAGIRAGLVALDEQIRLAKAMGIPITDEWIAMKRAESAPVSVSTTADRSEDDIDNGMKYPEGTLDRTPIAKLRIIAQNEQLEGYDDLTADEIREELYLIEK